MTEYDRTQLSIPIDSWTIDDIDGLIDSPRAQDPRPALLHEHLLVELGRHLTRKAHEDLHIEMFTRGRPPSLRVSSPVAQAGEWSLLFEIDAVLDLTKPARPGVDALQYWHIGLVPLVAVGYRHLPGGQYCAIGPAGDRIAFEEPWPFEARLSDLTAAWAQPTA